MARDVVTKQSVLIRMAASVLVSAAVAGSTSAFRVTGNGGWQSTVQGLPITGDQPITLTYGYVIDRANLPAQLGPPDDMGVQMVENEHIFALNVPGGFPASLDSELFSNLDLLFSVQLGISEAEARPIWQSLVDEAAMRWTMESAATLTFYAVNGFPDNWDDNGEGVDRDEDDMTPPIGFYFHEDGQSACLGGAAGGLGGIDGGAVAGNCVPESDTLVADIRIAMQPIDGPGGAAFIVIPPTDNDNFAAIGLIDVEPEAMGNVDPSVLFDDATDMIIESGGDIILDSQEEWANPVDNFRFFRNNITKAFGLALGLQEVEACTVPPRRIMERDPLFSPDFPPATDTSPIRSRALQDFAMPDFGQAVLGDLPDATSVTDVPFYLPLDDTRGIRELYADRLPSDPNNRTDPDMNFIFDLDPATASNLGTFTFQAGVDLVNDSGTEVATFDPTNSYEVQDDYLFTLISNRDDFSIDIVVTLTPFVPPTNTTSASVYANDAAANPCENPIDYTAGMDLQFQVFDVNGVPVSALVNDQPAGVVETVTLQDISEPGIYFVEVTQAAVPADEVAGTEVQLYNLQIDLVDTRFVNGVGVDTYLDSDRDGDGVAEIFVFDPNDPPNSNISRTTRDTAAEENLGVFALLSSFDIEASFAPLTHGGPVTGSTFVPSGFTHEAGRAWRAVRPDGLVGAEGGYTGRNIRVGVIHPTHPASGHEAFGGREIERFSYGTDVTTGEPLPGFAVISNRAVNSVSAVPTVALAAAGGIDVTAGPGANFRGMASDIEMVSATVAQDLLGDPTAARFTLSEQAVLFSLLGMADPDRIRDVPGGEALPAEPVDIILNAWGELGDARGDGRVALLYDWIASEYEDIFVISSAGGNFTDPFTNGVFLTEGGDAFLGGLCRGWRTMFTPSTAFNVMSIGSVGVSIDGLPSYLYPPSSFITDPEIITGIPFDLDFTRRPLDTVSQFSARGFADVSIFGDGGGDSSIAFNARHGIDLVALGDGLIDRDFTIEIPPRPDGFQPSNYFGHFSSRAFADRFTGRQNFGNGIPLNVPWVDVIVDPNTGEIVPDLENVAQNYESWGGTEMSAGFVAGAIALLREAVETYVATGILPATATDPLVTKAVLYNGARRTQHWSNLALLPGFAQEFAFGTPIRVDNAAVTVTESVDSFPFDSFQGAGVLDVGGALENLVLGYTFPPSTLDVIWPVFPFARPNPEDPSQPIDPLDPARGITRDVLATDPAVPAVGLQPVGTIEGLTPNVSAFGDGISPGVIPGTDILISGPAPLRQDGDVDVGGRVPFKDSFGGGGGGVGGGLFTPVDPAPVIEATEPVILPAFFVQPMGWDHGMIGVSQGDDDGDLADLRDLIYIIDEQIEPGDIFEITLVWNRRVELSNVDLSDPDNVNFGTISRIELEDLSLRLLALEPSLELQQRLEDAFVLASSDAPTSTVEYLSYEFQPTTGNGGEVISSPQVAINVRFDTTVYDFFDNTPEGEVEFALAWRVYPSANRSAVPPDVVVLTGEALFFEVLLRFGTVVGDDNYSPAADPDADGDIDANDFFYSIQHFGTN